MAKKKNSKKLIKNIISIIIVIIIVLMSQNQEIQKYISSTTSNLISENGIPSTIQENENGTKTIVIGSGNVDNENNLHVYYIDVGQADSILIVNKNQSALIDAGNNDDGQEVVNFIKSKGITKLDYVIGTHPHEDHIGGLDDVINNIDADKIYLPKIRTNTKTYEDVLQSIQNKNGKSQIIS